MGIRFRVDDVLQSKNFSPAQLESLAKKTMFEWFKEATEPFKGKPLTLAIVAEGIDSQPGWVDYIKAHPEWEPQVHCWKHQTYKVLPYKEIVRLLKKAKKKIDETFGVETIEFIPPKLAYNDKTQKAAKEVGLRENRLRYTPRHWLKDKTIKSIYFHYWDLKQIKKVKKMLKEVEIE